MFGLLSSLATLAAFLPVASANDPAGSWLSYVSYTDPGHGRITALNTSWIVPDEPSVKFGSNAPGWWFGIQTADGDGALIQPILAWGYQGSEYTIFNACFDWTDGSWHTSDEKYTVSAGDTIHSSVTYNAGDNSYTMVIESGGKTITTPYKIESGQTKNESTAYFVLEHQPLFCKAYPGDGVCTFTDVYLEVDGQAVDNPKWEAHQEKPKCNSNAEVVDAKTLKFTWDAKGGDEDSDTDTENEGQQQERHNVQESGGNNKKAEETSAPLKWGYGPGAGSGSGDGACKVRGPSVQQALCGLCKSFAGLPYPMEGFVDYIVNATAHSQPRYTKSTAEAAWGYYCPGY